MIKLLKKLMRDRRGNALVIAGASLPLVIGAAGLATDTIQWALWKRQLQRAADSAALAGVYAEAQSKSVDTTCASYSSSTYASPVSWDVKKNNPAWPNTARCRSRSRCRRRGSTPTPRRNRAVPACPAVSTRRFPR